MNTALTPCQATGTPGELPGGRRLGTHRGTFCPCQEGHQRALPRPVGGTNGSLPSRTQRGVHTAIPACLSSRSAPGPPRAPRPESHSPSTARPTHLTHQHLPPCPGLTACHQEISSTLILCSFYIWRWEGDTKGSLGVPWHHQERNDSVRGRSPSSLPVHLTA